LCHKKEIKTIIYKTQIKTSIILNEKSQKIKKNEGKNTKN
jgi:hypothetical protein